MSACHVCHEAGGNPYCTGCGTAPSVSGASRADATDKRRYKVTIGTVTSSDDLTADQALAWEQSHTWNCAPGAVIWDMLADRQVSEADVICGFPRLA